MQAADKLRLWREKPQAMVRELFGVTPDAWQEDVLAMFPHRQRIAMKACKGPGKTTLLAWLCWNFLLTRPRPKIAAVSISKENLADGLWTEMAKWMNKSDLLKASFTWTKTRIFANTAPEEWFMSARSWAKSGDSTAQADTLAGLHADYLLFVIDEAGGIPDAVSAAAEAGLANANGGGGQEAHLVIAGNPTHLEGPLYRACSSERSLWEVIEITSDPDDLKRTPRVSAEWARQQIKKWGAENPWVLVNVFGRFPPSSINALIGPDEVRAAMQRSYSQAQIDGFARILGVDVAREGDDKSIILPRQGMVVFPWKTLRNVDSLVGASNVAWKWREWEADGCMVDATGGFGAGWIDQLRVLNREPIGVQFAGKATNDTRYVNKRAEMYVEACQWIKDGGQLPDESNEGALLLEELVAHTYTFVGDKMLIEPKDAVKEKIGRSPDISDGFALTFAFPVAKRDRGALTPSGRSKEYDPYEALR